MLHQMDNHFLLSLSKVFTHDTSSEKLLLHQEYLAFRTKFDKHILLQSISFILKLGI